MFIMRLSANTMEVTLNGNRVFYSYDTPVAVKLSTGEVLVTNQFFSKTTSKHINTWVGDNLTRKVSQEDIAAYVKQ